MSISWNHFLNTHSISISVQSKHTVAVYWYCGWIQSSWPDFVNVKEKWWGEETKKKFSWRKIPSWKKREREKKNASLKRAKVGTWKHQILFFHPLTTTMLTCGVWVYVWDCVPTKVFIPHWRPLRAGGVSVSTNGM